MTTEYIRVKSHEGKVFRMSLKACKKCDYLEAITNTFKLSEDDIVLFGYETKPLLKVAAAFTLKLQRYDVLEKLGLARFK